MHNKQTSDADNAYIEEITGVYHNITGVNPMVITTYVDDLNIITDDEGKKWKR